MHGATGGRGGIPGRIAGRMASLQLPAQWKCYLETLELYSFVFRGKKEAPSSGPWPRPTTQRIPSLVPFLNFQDFDEARDRVESAKKKGANLKALKIHQKPQILRSGCHSWGVNKRWKLVHLQESSCSSPLRLALGLSRWRIIFIY